MKKKSIGFGAITHGIDSTKVHVNGVNVKENVKTIFGWHTKWYFQGSLRWSRYLLTDGFGSWFLAEMNCLHELNQLHGPSGTGVMNGMNHG